jgi:hypothetical protein
MVREELQNKISARASRGSVEVVVMPPGFFGDRVASTTTNPTHIKGGFHTG